MLKLILTLGIASLAVACANPGYMSSQGDASSTGTMGAPGTTMEASPYGQYGPAGASGDPREPANF